MMEQDAHDEIRRKPITGRYVLICLVAFFAVVGAANAVLVKTAISTFGGVETDSSYRAGLLYGREIAAAFAQESRHWQVTAKVLPAKNGMTEVEVLARDAAGRPVTGLDATVTLAHPTDRRRDHIVAVHEDGPGRFRGLADVPSGGWDLVLELSRGDERVFLSRNRVGVR